VEFVELAERAVTEQDPVNRGPEREVGVLVLVTERTD
jgi:hypothetical protein